MLSWVFELMPLFVVRIASQRCCEQFVVHGELWASARKGVLIKMKEGKHV